MVFVNTKTARSKLGVSANTLRNWDRSGKIKTMRTPGGVRLYDLGSLDSFSKSRIVYARVSSRGQKDDLSSQVRYLSERFPEHEIVQDYGSGLNFKRKGFNTILERVMSGDVSEVVIVHRDRLCRFGFDFVEFVFQKFGCRVVVLEESKLSPQSELVQDLLSIIHVFSCRLYGLRKYSRKIKEDTDIPKEQAIDEDVLGVE